MNRRAIFYLGCFYHNIDSSRRIRIPAQWRPVNANGNDLTCYAIMNWPAGGQDVECIQVLPQQIMQELLEKVEGLHKSNSDLNIKRIICSFTQIVHMDKIGRLCIPENMAIRARIERQAILAGQVDRFQIWNPELYKIVTNADKQHMHLVFQNL